MGAKSLEQIRIELQRRLLIEINLLISLLVGAAYVNRLNNVVGDNFTVHLVPMFIALLLLLTFRLYRGSGIDLPANILLVAMALVLPLRTYSSGGLVSSNLCWYLASTVVVSFLYGKNTQRVYFAYLIGSLTFFLIFPPPRLETAPLVYFIPAVGGLLGIMFTINKWWKLQEAKLRIEKKLEEIETIKAMLSTLEHEINNPLTILNGHLHFLKGVAGADNVAPAELALSRIKNLVSDVREKIDKHGLESRIARETDEFDTYLLDDERDVS